MSKLLKERRIEVGKELNEISELTHINGSYLRSIEEEEFGKLPVVEVYTRGYIKEYAHLLGLPSNIALEPYEKYINEAKDEKEKDVTPASSDKKSLYLKMSGIFVAIVIMTGMSFSVFTARDVHRIQQLSSSVSSNQQPPQVLLPAPDSNVESKGLQNSENEILQEKLAYAGDSELLKRPAKHTLNINSSEQNPLEKQNDSNDTAGQPSESMQHQEAPVTLGPAEVLLPAPDNNAGLNGLQHSENNMSQEKPAGAGDSELLTKKELNINGPEQNPLKKQNDSNDTAGQPSESMQHQEAPVTLGLAEVTLPVPDNSAGLNDLQDSQNNNIPQEKQDDSNDTAGQLSESISHQEAPLALGPAQMLLPAFGQQCRLSSSSEF